MDNNKKSALVDAAVAIVFFNRDDTLKEVFKKNQSGSPVGAVFNTGRSA